MAMMLYDDDFDTTLSFHNKEFIIITGYKTRNQWWITPSTQ